MKLTNRVKTNQFIRITDLHISVKHTALTLALLLTLIGCSDSSTISTIAPPQFVPEVTYPFIDDNILYEFDPTLNDDNLDNTGTSKSTQLVGSANELIISIDTDQSTFKEDEEGNIYQAHSALPEYVAFTQENSLFLYDLETRYTHLLYDFTAASNPNNDPENDPETICDLQKSVTVDEESFNQNEILFKDELLVYVQASSSGDCTQTTLNAFYAIKITESATDTFEIRQLVSSTDSDDNQITTIQRITHPIIYGTKTTTEEALMYAGQPIFNSDIDKFGYLGIDSRSLELKFFLTDIEDLSKSILWRIQSDDFDLQASFQQEYGANSIATVIPSKNRLPSHHLFYDSIMLEHGWDIVKLDLEHIFDDDHNLERTNSVEAPLFSRDDSIFTEYKPLEVTFSPGSDDFIFSENERIYIVADNTASISTLSIPQPPSPLISSSLEYVGGNVVVKKQFTDIYSSLTALNTINVEGTLIPFNTNIKLAITIDEYNVLIANIENKDDKTWQSLAYNNSLAIADDLQRSLLVPHIDSREYSGPSTSILLLQENDTTDSTFSALGKPSVSCYLSNIEAYCPPGQVFGIIDKDITGSTESSFTSLSDDYGIATLSYINNNQTTVSRFYYDPIDTNPNDNSANNDDQNIPVVLLQELR